MDKGKVFISSTVSDFEDLRSALKYWLSEMGYEVFTSETCDFPKDSTESSYQACFSTIEKCDWYILLIGNRYGSTFRDPTTNETISITRAEYRTAYRLFTEGKIKKIVPFVRQKVWTAKQERECIAKSIESKDLLDQVINSPSPNADMPSEIFSFIDEIGKSYEMTKAHSGEIPYPRGNWINIFHSFSDIIATLQVELNLTQRLSTLVYKENLTEEIKQNLKKLYVKNSKGYFGIYDRITPIRNKCIQQLRENDKAGVSLTIEECQMIAGTFIGFITLNDSAIKECLLSGVFLDFDSCQNRYKQSQLSKCLAQLESTIQNINSYSKDKYYAEARSYFMHLARNKRQESYGKLSPECVKIAPLSIEYAKIALILSEHDQIGNAIKLSRALLSYFHSGKELKNPELYPQRLHENFEVPVSKKKLFSSYDEFYGKELSDQELDDLVSKLEGEQHET